jgi:hypothetical protein
MRIRVNFVAVKKKYSACESVLLVTQDAKRICRILLLWYKKKEG